VHPESGRQCLLEIDALVVGVMPEVGDQPGRETRDCGLEAKPVPAGVAAQVGQGVRGLRESTNWSAAGTGAEDRLVDAEIAALGLGFAMSDQLDALDRGAAGGPEANASKVYWSESYRRLCELGADLAAAGFTESHDAWMTEYYDSLATSIYAGTNEIQRNIVAERALVLPR
jgi:alkylation response protein AidB-like acyl-CoA dehydrogenase